MTEAEPLRVLIADDEDKNTFALSSYLETYEIKVLIAKNGKETIEFLSRGEKIDVILLDIMMPVMDGYETLTVLHGHDTYKRVPVIALTAKAMKGDKEKCLEYGAWDYISKPVDLKNLLDKISRCVSSSFR